MMSRAIKHLRGLLLVQLAAILLIYPTTTATPQAIDRVVLNVTVANEKRTAVLDLGRESFSVNIDKRPQSILSFNGDVPANIGILIDTSASLANRGQKTLDELKQNLKAGLERFFELGHPANEYFLMTFNNEVALVEDWTRQPASITNKLAGLEYKGRTSLYDAISKAVAKVSRGRNTKQILLLFSDGSDSFSRATFRDARESLKRSEVVLYAIGLLDPSFGVEKPPFIAEGISILEEYAANTGGRTSFSDNPSNPAALSKALESFAVELRTQYQLVILAEEATGKEKWRKLNVTATRNDASGRPEKLSVRTRKGYYR
jgi:Ca-activated chloride channel homolog